MLRILLVEDDPHVATVTRDLLEYCGYHATVATNGSHGLDVIRKQSPDLVITDFMMPMMSGLEMIEKARETGYPGTVIVCSAVPEAQFPRHHARYDFFLQKPYDVHALLKVLAHLHEPL